MEPVLAARVESLLKQAFLARRKMLRHWQVWPIPTTQALAASAGFSLQRRLRNSPRTWVALAGGLNRGDERPP